MAAGVEQGKVAKTRRRRGLLLHDGTQACEVRSAGAAHLDTFQKPYEGRVGDFERGAGMVGEGPRQVAVGGLAVAHIHGPCLHDAPCDKAADGKTDQTEQDQHRSGG